MHTAREAVIAMVFFLVHSTSVYPQAKSPVFTDPKASGFFKPKMEIEGGPNYDFGNIYRGEKVTHVFTIKNVGSDTLLITNVSSSCGCTAALASSNRVPPKSKTELNVTFTSENFSGRVTKVATVTTNDPVSPSQPFTITANVLQVLEANPSLILFGRAKVDSMSTTSVQLKNLTDRPLTILSVENKLRDLRVDLGKKILKPGETTELKASFKPQKEGMAWGEVVVKTDFRPQPNVLVRFTTNVFK